jgi:hypothetical protein
MTTRISTEFTKLGRGAPNFNLTTGEIYLDRAINHIYIGTEEGNLDITQTLMSYVDGSITAIEVYSIEDVLPETIEQGKLVLYVGQIYRGLTSDEGVEGTPFLVNSVFNQDDLQAPDITAENDFIVKTGVNKTLVLERPVWRDEYPAFLVPAGGAKAPDPVDATIGGVQRRVNSFDGNNTEEILSGSFEIPHDMMIGTLILPELHVHWRPATTGVGVVKWFFDWEYSPPNAAPIPMTTLDVTDEILVNNQYWHKLTTFGYLPQPLTEFSLGGKIGFNIRRTPADDEDTYAGEVYLEQVALHVPCDTNGSRQIYVK